MERQNKGLKIIWEDDNLLVVDKPAGIVVYQEEDDFTETLIKELLKRFPFLKNVGQAPRYGIVHRLDKETSGILLVAKNNKTLNFLQKEFKTRKVQKKYLGLVVGNLKSKRATIETLIGRGPKNKRKQKIYLPLTPEAQRKGLRKAKTRYRVLKKFFDKKTCYSLLELMPETGRKHQIRAHMSYIQHPIAGDKLYGFKKQPSPKGLSRHFLHARYLKIRLLDGKEKKFISDLPEDLKKVIKNLKEIDSLPLPKEIDPPPF